ncbi:MAG: hypothetical protein R3F38_07045 [Gammaproteobacteria bacterium]
MDLVFAAKVTPAIAAARPHDMIVPTLNDFLSAVLTGYRIVLASFVVRSSGSVEQDMPLHQDWTFVDGCCAISWRLDTVAG